VASGRASPCHLLDQPVLAHAMEHPEQLIRPKITTADARRPRPCRHPKAAPARPRTRRAPPNATPISPTKAAAAPSSGTLASRASSPPAIPRAPPPARTPARCWPSRTARTARRARATCCWCLMAASPGARLMIAGRRMTGCRPPPLRAVGRAGADRSSRPASLNALAPCSRKD
jgi:hypothetical protein